MLESFDVRSSGRVPPAPPWVAGRFGTVRCLPNYWDRIRLLTPGSPRTFSNVHALTVCSSNPTPSSSWIALPPGGRACHRRRTWGIHIALQNPLARLHVPSLRFSFFSILYVSSITAYYILYTRFSALQGDIAVEELSWYLHTGKRAHYLPHHRQRPPPLSS